MKTGLYLLANELITNIAIVFCFAPFLLVLRKKLLYQKTYLLIGIYWLLTGLLNQYRFISHATNNHLQAQLMFVRNLIGIHFVFVIFLISSKFTKRKGLFYSMLGFILFEALILIWNGFENGPNLLIIGMGSFLIIIHCIFGLVGYLKEIQHSTFENTMAFTYASFLFAYSGSTLICLLNLFNVSNSTDPDEFFLYYVGILLSSLLSCFGLWQYAEIPSFYKSKK